MCFQFIILFVSFWQIMGAVKLVMMVVAISTIAVVVMAGDGDIPAHHHHHQQLVNHHHHQRRKPTVIVDVNGSHDRYSDPVPILANDIDVNYGRRANAVPILADQDAELVFEDELSPKNIHNIEKPTKKQRKKYNNKNYLKKSYQRSKFKKFLELENNEVENRDNEVINTDNVIKSNNVVDSGKGPVRRGWGVPDGEAVVGEVFILPIPAGAFYGHVSHYTVSEKTPIHNPVGLYRRHCAYYHWYEAFVSLMQRCLSPALLSVCRQDVRLLATCRAVVIYTVIANSLWEIIYDGA